MNNYKFATDSECGTIKAADWNEACQKLEAMVPDSAVDAGGWGWVEDTDGERFAINCDGDESRGM
jgi:hypothetical protein